jgi:DNA gyrase subunit A
VVLETGKVVRSSVGEVPAKGRDTMGVVFARFEESDKILAVARNSERNLVSAEDVTAEEEVSSADAVVEEAPNE